jgi:acyl-CoA dehydrogenase
MDFGLNQEQRAWQVKARKFAEESIRPISLERDAISAPQDTWDWDIIKKGSKLGFRTAVVSKDRGGHGIDFVTQALVMAELARGDSAISKAFSQCWKWSHLIAEICTKEQQDRFLTPFLADDTYVLGKGGTEPSAGSDNRMPPEDDPKAGHKLRGERVGDDWILNGEKTFIANGSVGKLFFIDVRTNPNVSIKEGTTLFLVPRDTPGFRIGKVFNKRGWRFYQNAELIFENARVPHANVVGEVNGALAKGSGDSSGGDLFGDLELAANALGVCDAACEQAINYARTQQQGGKPLVEQQHVLLKINRMWATTEALRSYVMRVAWEHDQRIHSANAGLVMNMSTDAIQQVTEMNLEIHANADALAYRQADKLVRDSFIWSHLAGDNVQRLKVSKRVAKLAPVAANLPWVAREHTLSAAE